MAHQEKVLTLQELKQAAPGTVLRSGFFKHPENKPEDPRSYRFVAVRGEWYDWAIYYMPARLHIEDTLRRGKKLCDTNVVTYLVATEKEVLEKYRK